MIMARLSHKRISRYFEFLIDSGSDYTLISKSHAVLLGIDLKKLKTDKVELANLSFIKVYKSRLSITINNTALIIPVLIADEEVECLLGRKGVFEHFEVLFQENKSLVTFKYKI